MSRPPVRPVPLQLHILVSSESVQLNLDCQEVAVKEVKAAGNTSSDGYQVLGKMSKSIGSKGQSATVSQHIAMTTRTHENMST